MLHEQEVIWFTFLREGLGHNLQILFPKTLLMEPVLLCKSPVFGLNSSVCSLEILNLLF